jgi:hypothetical protein
MSTRPTIWPQVVIDDGPPIAGIEPGDAIAFAPGKQVFCAAHPLGERVALRIWSHETELVTLASHRVMSEPLRVERRASAQRTWTILDEPQRTIAVGPWRLRFVVDGAPLATSKRIGSHLVAHCTGLGTTQRLHGERSLTPEGELLFSQWVIPSGGATRSLFVIERAPGDLVHVVRPRASGIDLFEMERLAGGALDAEIAAGIAMQADDDHSGIAAVGWDGVLRHLDDTRARFRYGCRARIFAQLTRTDPARAKEDLERMRAASIAEVSGFVRALDPESAARDAALVEECGVLAG